MSRLAIAIIWSILLLGAACAESGEQPLTISEDEMVKLLLDAHMVESALQDVSHGKRDSVKNTFYDHFYKIHEITEEDFVKNVEIMDKQPEMLSRIYSKVMEEVSKLEAKD